MEAEWERELRVAVILQEEELRRAELERLQYQEVLLQQARRDLALVEQQEREVKRAADELELQLQAARQQEPVRLSSGSLNIARPISILQTDEPLRFGDREQYVPRPGVLRVPSKERLDLLPPTTVLYTTSSQILPQAVINRSATAITSDATVLPGVSHHIKLQEIKKSSENIVPIAITTASTTSKRNLPIPLSLSRHPSSSMLPALQAESLPATLPLVSSQVDNMAVQQRRISQLELITNQESPLG